MGTNTGLGIGIGIPFKNNALGGDKPYFPPELKARMIGVWTNYGKKNTDTDRNIIKNKIPNAGGDLEILNAAYKLNSGFGEYSEDFTTWTKSSKITSVDSESFDFVTNVNWNLLYYKSNIGKDIPSFKVRIKLKGEGKVFYNYITSEGVYTNEAITSEEYVTPISYNTKYTGETPVNCGFSIGITSEEGSGTITQIPNFEDAFVTDGINDMIVSQKTLQEMGVTKELTIVSMIHQISWRDSASVPLTNYIRPSSNNYVRSHVSNIGKTGIYGYVCYDISNSGAGNSHVVNTILGDKNDYSINIVGDLSQGKFSVQGYMDGNGNILETSSVAHYWTFAVLGKATEDEINLIIGNYNLDRSLKPDILCNIGKQGITNDNHADFNDKLIDYSGNGRDIQMNNLAWKGGSGIAAKPFETIKDYTILSDEARQKLTIYNEFSYKVKSNTPNHYWIVQSIIKDNTSYQVTIITDKDCYWINSTSFTNNEGNKESIRKEYLVKANTPTQVTICGLNEFEYPEGIEPTSAVSYVNLEYAGEITITFISSCKGGLLLDGVNDFGKVTGMPIYKDYTFIIEREFLNETFPNQACLVSKSKVASEIENGGAFIVDNISVNSIINPYSFYKTTSLPGLNTFDRQIVFQSKYKYLDKDIAAGTATDSDTLWLGTFRDNDSRFANVAIYSLMSFPYSMSEFLIERQLKKHKLGTLYPNMVEFRPVIKANDNYKIFYTAMLPLTGDIWERINIGDYVPVGRRIAIQMSFDNEAKKLVSAVSSQLGNITIVKNSNNIGYTIFGDVLKDKSPQKISITIEQDENYILFNPVITSNVEYVRLDFYLNNYQKRINIGDYIPKDAYLRANFYLKNNVDELTVFTFNGVNIGYRRSSVDDTAFNINQIYNYDSPQEVNITIDEYIRYEDIVQPYPVLLRFNDENGNEVSWGGKFRVGSTITRIGSAADSNLLPNIYNIFGLLLNGNQVTSSKVIVEKTMVFKAKSAYIFDNNEPKCILSPRLLRIPNSSYKILGYIPDISGHGNHGVIHNSAYAEGSGVNEDGSYQFDGVDDFVTIPTTVGGKQVLMKVNWQSVAGMAILYDQRTNGGFAIFNRDFDTNENKVPAYRARNIGGSTYIDGILNKYIYASELKNITHNIVELHDPKLNIGTLNPKIGSSYLNSNYTQMSLYDFMLFDEISTDDKIKELNKYVGIEAKVELPPYYWDTYGKTNLDADKATIQQRGVAVGDYDLTNYNHAYEGMSGYNGYPVVFGANKTWTNESNGYVTSITSNTIHITNVLNAGLALLYSYVKYNGNLQNIKEIPPFKIEIKGLEGRSKFIYKYLATSDATKETNLYLGNGTHELPKSFLPTEALVNDAVVGFSISPIEEGVTNFLSDITIEVLPEYENGLAYDGVEDYSENVNIPIVDDFTFLVKASLLKGFTGSGGLIARKGDVKHVTSGGYAFVYCLDSSSNEANRNSYYSFGKALLPSTGAIDPPLIGYMTKTSVNGVATTFGTNPDIKGINFGDWNGGRMSMVVYKSILYPKTIPLLQINFLKNLMEKDGIIDLNNPIFIQE